MDSSSTLQFIASFNGTLLALLSAAALWLIKSAYEKHKSENFALTRLERVFVIDGRYLLDNEEFIDRWIASLKTGRPYSCKFDTFLTNDEDTYKISDLSLVNRVITANYKLRRMSFDLENIYNNYWELLPKFENADSVQQYHQTVINTLTEMKGNYPLLSNELLEIIAHIRERAYIREHSLFGYLGKLFIDVYPRFEQKRFESRLAALKKRHSELD